jgi:hypothetical protein
MWGKENMAKKDRVTRENIRHFKFIEECLIRDGAIPTKGQKTSINAVGQTDTRK